MEPESGPSQVLDALAEQLVCAGDSEEELYDSSNDFAYSRVAFSSVREAFLYRAHSMVREIAQTWAPLGTPADAERIAAWGESPHDHPTILIAFFRRDNLIAYLAVRELVRGFEKFGLYLGVARADIEPQPGGGEGDEGRAWLHVSRLRG